MLTAIAGAKAQNCDAIMLPYFGGDSDEMASYPAEKLQWRCQYARNAFYVSDVVPEDAIVKSIADVVDRSTGNHLDKNFVVDLNTLSYYGYNFEDMQHQTLDVHAVICFETPGSEHPYLVLRSLDETYRRTEFPENY